MKKLLLILLAALLLASCAAPELEETTAPTPPQERCLLQTVTAVYETYTLREEYVYNGDGILNAVIAYQDDVQTYRAYITCDETGREIRRSIRLPGSAEEAARIDHVYDDQGNLISSCTSVAGAPTVTETRTYIHGVLVELLQEDHANGTKMLFRYTYDAQHKLFSAVCTDGDGNPVSVTEYTHDGLVTTAVTRDASGTPTVTYTYTYQLFG